MAEPTPNLPAETEDRPWLTEQNSVIETIAERRKAELQNSSIQAPQEQPVPTQTQQPQPEQRFLEDGLDTTFVHRKIDGRDEAISVADLLATAQMDGAAANRLAQAKAFKDEWARKLQELEHHQTEQQAPSTPTSQRQDPDRIEALENILNAYQQGDELPVHDVNALFGNTPARQPVNIDLAAIAQQVRTQFEVDDGLVTYNTDYADIANNPRLDAIAAEYLEQAMQTGKPFKQALIESAEHTRQWVREVAGLPALAPTPNPPTAQSQREQARANLRTMPVANARVDTSTPAPMSLDEHRRQRINEMRNT